MKKILIPAVFFIVLGFFLGQIIFCNNNISFKQNEKAYFLQEGVYNNSSNIQTNLIDLIPKVVENKDNKYYVYVGITRDRDIAKLLEDIYNKRGIKVYTKEKEITSSAFIINVEQFDLLIKDSIDSDQILTIEEIVLGNYEEIIKNNSKNKY